MAKRSATSELNHDNWDAEEEKEEAGTFKPLNPEDLQNRVIKKAKRSLGNRESSASSPFATFSGFASSASGSPFSFLKKNNTDSEENSASSIQMNIASKNEKNGTSDGDEEKKEAEGEEVQVKTNSTSSSTSNKSKAVRSLEYYRKLQSLNESVLKWMQLHLSKNSLCDFSPVFNDYKKHLDTLNVTYPVKSKETDDEVFKRPSLSESEIPKAKTKMPISEKQSSVKSGHTIKKDETDYGANFRSNTTNTSTISLGIKLSPTETSSSSLSGPTMSSKSNDNVQEQKPFQFSFGLKQAQFSDPTNMTKPFNSLNTPAADSNINSGGDEDSEYVPPKNEFNAVAEEDAFYSKRCKLFYKKGDGYAEKGIGILYLKPLDGKTQLLIRADTNLGNVLLNIVLSASLPMSRTGKNNVLLVCVPNPPVDVKISDSKEAIPILIRVKTSEDADELLENLNKYKS